MIELPLAFVGGLLGTAHCVGMCGPFAISIGAAAHSTSSQLIRQASYSAGRIFTYAFLGAVAGYSGWRVAQEANSLIMMQASLSIVAGVLLLWQGLRAAGWLPWQFRVARRPQAGCLAQGALGTFLTAPGWHNAFLAGILTGFLPCGLLYAYLALAVSGGSLLFGMTLMVAFGAGTVPLMVVVGLAASLVGVATRQRLLRLAAVCVILTGVVSIHRGVMFARTPTSAGSESAETIACPACASDQSSDLLPHDHVVPAATMHD